MRRIARAALLGVFVCGAAHASKAADTIHLGKAEAVPWTFIPADIAVEQGFFAKYGLDVEITDMGGDAKLQQAMAAGSLDFGLGSGPAMAFAAKGAPAMAVAAFAGSPRNMVIVVAADSPLHDTEDLKGTLIAVSSIGSLTDWLAKRIGVQSGWGPTSVRTLGLGTFDASFAAVRTHQVDGMVTAAEMGYQLEAKHTGRILTGLEDYAPHFITHVVFARRQLIADKPDLVARFLKGFFSAIRFMKKNKIETTIIAARVLHQDPEVMSRAYDREIAMMEDDGSFDPQAIEVLKQSWVEMGTLPDKPADDLLFATKFVPINP